MVRSCGFYLTCFPDLNSIGTSDVDVDYEECCTMLAKMSPFASINSCLLEDCLLHVFHRLPLKNLLEIGPVCSLWDSLQYSASCRRRSLTLLIGDDPSCLIGDPDLSPCLDHMVGGDKKPLFSLPSGSLEWAKLEFASLDSCMCENLVAILPNIIHLEISMNEVSSALLYQVMYLLAFWGPRLVSLRFCAELKEAEGLFSKPDDFIAYNLSRLLDVINYRLPALKHLTFHSWNHVLPQMYNSNFYNIPQRIHLPVLVQLEEVYFYSLDQADTLYESLVKFAVPNKELRQIGMPNPISNERTMAMYLHGANRQICSLTEKINFLGIYYPTLNKADLDVFCVRFPMLTSLWIYLDPGVFVNTLARLVRLEHLCFLQVSMHFPEYRQVQVDPEDYTPVIVIESTIIPQLPTVKALYLRVRTLAHSNIWTMPLLELFPKLEVLEIDNPNSQCTICDSSNDNEVVGGKVQKENGGDCNGRRNCLRALGDPFITGKKDYHIVDNLVVVKY